ncbi:hypothetical protein FKM82_017920 [Ascaphus truei]
MNMKAHLVFVFCAGGYFATVFGYPSGKVSDSCDAMLPMHGKSVPQTLAAPYNVIVSNNTFSPGDVITVTLRSSSGNGFKGFLLQARSVGGDRITGAFTITDSKMTQGLPCSAGARRVHQRDLSVSPYIRIRKQHTAESQQPPTLPFRVGEGRDCLL